LLERAKDDEKVVAAPLTGSGARAAVDRRS